MQPDTSQAITLVLSLVAAIGVAVLGLLWAGLPTYVAEKAKNTASKEDLRHLTELVESTKVQYTVEIERLKAELLSKGQVTERRRKVYEELAAAMTVFIEGNVAPNSRERYQAAYASAWLWASDEVLASLNEFIKLQVEHAEAGRPLTNQPRLKLSYAATVLEMRRDAGFENTTASTEDYRFTRF